MFEPDQGEAPPANAPRMVDGGCAGLGNPNAAKYDLSQRSISEHRKFSIPKALAALLVDPELRRGVGSAWPLYLMLVLQWGGTATGTREDLGARMTEDGRNVGNWVAALERAGIVSVEKRGRRMTVALTGEHMAVARMDDGVAVAKAAAPAEPARGTRQLELLDLMDKAKSLGGEAEVRIVVRAK